jgi:hypothetical protein
VCRARPPKRDRRDEAVIVDVDVIVDAQPHVVEHLHLVGDEADRARMAAPLSLGERLLGLKQDVRVKRLFDMSSPRTHVAGAVGLVKGGYPALCDLHVLLRHRPPSIRSCGAEGRSVGGDRFFTTPPPCGIIQAPYRRQEASWRRSFTALKYRGALKTSSPT